MSIVGTLSCRVRRLFGESEACSSREGSSSTAMEDESGDHLVEMMYERDVEEKRLNYGPDGQPLPDYLSYSQYGTMMNGQWIQTGAIVQVAQTYYGPWIPLSDGWTYGGLTSPTGDSDPAPAATQADQPAPQGTYAAQPPAPQPDDGSQDDGSWDQGDDQGQDQGQDWGGEDQDQGQAQDSGQDWGQDSGQDPAGAQNQAAPAPDPNAQAPQDPAAAQNQPADDSTPNPAPAPAPAPQPDNQNAQPAPTPAPVAATPSPGVTPQTAVTPATATAVPPTLVASGSLTSAVVSGSGSMSAVSGSGSAVSGSGSKSSAKKKTSTKKDTITYQALPAEYKTSMPDSAFRSGSLASQSANSSTSACPSGGCKAQHDKSDANKTVAVVPAVLVPLLLILAAVGLVLAYLWRKKRNNQMISRSFGTGPKGFGNWLLSFVMPKRRKQDRYTRVAPPTTPTHRRSILKSAQANSPSYQSPTEKTAMLNGMGHQRSQSYYNLSPQQPEGYQSNEGGLMNRLSGGLGNLSPARWGSATNSPSPRRTSGNTAERGLMDDNGGPFGNFSDNNPYRNALSANGFGGATASPNGNGGYISLDAEDHDGPLVFSNSPGYQPDGTPGRSKSEYTPSRPSALGRYMSTAEYEGGPPPFHLSNPNPYMEDGEKKTQAEVINAEGQDVGEISPAAYAARQGGPYPYDRNDRGLMSPDSLLDGSISAVSPVSFPVAQLSSDGHARDNRPDDSRRMLYGPGRVNSPPEYSAYADYSELLSSYERTSQVGRAEGATSPSRASAVSPVTALSGSGDGHTSPGVPHIMDMLAKYGYDPNTSNPIAHNAAGPSRTPPVLLEPAPVHHGKNRRGSALEERLMPSKSPRGARSPALPRSPRRKGYALHDGRGPSPGGAGSDVGGMSDVSHYSDEKETVVSGTGDLADMIRNRTQPSPARSRSRPLSTDASSMYTTPSEGHSSESASARTMTEVNESHALMGQRLQPQVIRNQTPLRVPGGWTDMPAPPRPLGFSQAGRPGSNMDFGNDNGGPSGPNGGGIASSQSVQSAGQFGSGWFRWITEAGGNTMSRGT